VSVILCRASNGAHVVYPICENTHENGILRRTVAPAPDFSGSLVTEANHFALRLAEHLNYVGVLALELFVVGESLLANEFAPRVHNSGHWTIEGAITSQFENHVRAVTGLPLGSAELRAPAVMTNLIGHIPDKERLLAIPDTHLHDYGKAARPGRKVGHVTCVGGTARETEQHAALVQALVDARPAG
jgi:5-(carboxyamino)imidazole ribonucleotide synthase